MGDIPRTILIANPRAGGGLLGQRWPAIAAIVAREIGAFQHRFTAGPGEGTMLAQRATEEGYGMVVAVGGDGTINEIVNGLLASRGGDQASLPLLGVLHFGTGGDFCRTAGIPHRLRDGARVLAGATTRTVDVGRASFVDHQGRPAQRYYVNVASFGISGMVDEIVNQSAKPLGGRVAFGLATLQAMRRYRAQNTILRFDGVEEIQARVHNVAVANGQCFGGGMRIAPRAQLEDGLLDIVVLSEIGYGTLLRHGHRVYRGTHLDLPFVSYRQARMLEALPSREDTPVRLDIDGETPGRLPASFEVVPAALRLKSRSTASVARARPE